MVETLSFGAHAETPHQIVAHSLSSFRLLPAGLALISLTMLSACQRNAGAYDEFYGALTLSKALDLVDDVPVERRIPPLVPHFDVLLVHLPDEIKTWSVRPETPRV